MIRTIGLCAAVLTGLAGRLPAQAVAVTGTGDPNVDVPAVQAAVNQGGHIVLTGHFSFDALPTNPDGANFSRIITVSKGVVISGDSNGEMAAIEGGYFPFYVDTPDASVVIEGLHFVRPKGTAIFVNATCGLVIARCRIEGVEPSTDFGGTAAQPNPLANAVTLGTLAFPAPENFSGSLLILNNDIDVGGTAGDQTLGISVSNVGQSPDNEVDLTISGNNLRNITERVINLNFIGGRAYVERNVIATGSISGPSNGVQPDVIHTVGSGSYLVAHNSIDCAWATGAGIRIQGQAGKPVEGVIVVDNDVTMTAADGTVFGANSAGIEVRGPAAGNMVLNNRIQGRARAALALVNSGGTPASNTFVRNDLTDFASSEADIVVDAGVTNTIVVGTQSKVEDHGAGTVVVPIQ